LRIGECHYAEFHYAECHYVEFHIGECHYAECHYAECHYAECHYAKCRGDKFSTLIAATKSISVEKLIFYLPTKRVHASPNFFGASLFCQPTKTYPNEGKGTKLACEGIYVSYARCTLG
jgi:hypothetical protein